MAVTDYKILIVGNRGHVIRYLSRDTANYRGTGMALAGILGKKESLQMWYKRVILPRELKAKHKTP